MSPENNKGKKKIAIKLMSAFVVSLFLMGALGAMASGPIQSETTAESFETTVDCTGDNAGPSLPRTHDAVDYAADFTINNDERALEMLNTCIIGANECEWNVGSKTLTLTPVYFETICTDDEGLGAALVLPGGSTIVVTGDGIIRSKQDGTHKTSFGIYCKGDLTIDLGSATLECVTGIIQMTEKDENEFSAGIYVEGKLTVTSLEYGRLAVSTGYSNHGPMYGICANEFVLEKTELICSTLYGYAHTIGLRAPTITINNPVGYRATIVAGGSSARISFSTSYGIESNHINIVNGTLIATGGSDVNPNDSYGIHMTGDNALIEGAGSLNVTGGTGITRSCGIMADNNLAIDGCKVSTSTMFSNSLVGILANGTLNISNNSYVSNNLTTPGLVIKSWGISAEKLIIDGSSLICTNGCGGTSYGIIVKGAMITNSYVFVGMYDSKYNITTDIEGFTTTDNTLIKDSKIIIKIGASRFSSCGLIIDDRYGNVPRIENSTIHVECDDGVKDCIANGMKISDLNINGCEIFVKVGYSPCGSTAVQVLGGNLSIENSKVKCISGSTTGTGSTENAIGLYTTGSKITIKESEVTFFAGKTNNDASYGMSILNNTDFSFTISNSKFASFGNTMSMKVNDTNRFTMNADVSLYGFNTKTNTYEKVDVLNINDYINVATDNWEFKEVQYDTSLIVVLIAVMAFVSIVGIMLYRRD